MINIKKSLIGKKQKERLLRLSRQAAQVGKLGLLSETVDQIRAYPSLAKAILDSFEAKITVATATNKE